MWQTPESIVSAMKLHTAAPQAFLARPPRRRPEKRSTASLALNSMAECLGLDDGEREIASLVLDAGHLPVALQLRELKRSAVEGLCLSRDPR